MKEIIGIFTVALAFVAYVPYLRDIIRDKTKPHPYSWFIWGLLNSLIFALQVTHGAGAGSYVTLSVGVLSFLIFYLGLKKHGVTDITRLDTAAFITALLATLIWLLARQPLTSMLLIMFIDLLALVPTIRKSWHRPHTETLFMWSVNGFRHALSIGAIREYNAITLINPVLWSFVDGLFSLFLIIRRRQTKNQIGSTGSVPPRV